MDKDKRTPEQKGIEDEVEDLRRELEHFQQEKERVRAIVGKIGGMPTFNIKLFNIVFIAIMVVTLLISLFSSGLRLLMIELATVALAVKILYMMHCQSKVNHFQLWMQSSIEWRINEIMKLMKKTESVPKSKSPNRDS